MEQRAKSVNLAELRKLFRRTQSDLARSMGVKQPRIAQMEANEDMKLGDLGRFVSALGARLKLSAILPDGKKFEIQMPSRNSVRLSKKNSRQICKQEMTMGEFKALIMEYEFTDMDVRRIVDFYNAQRSEEQIEDIEAEIDRSPHSRIIYAAIDKSYRDYFSIWKKQFGVE